MKHSCGALLYSWDLNGNFGIILGSEKDNWLPFKGGPDKDETYEQAAIREIYEETCGLVKLDNINLDHVFNTKHKIYHIGLIYVDYEIIKQFPIEVAKKQVGIDYRFLEKTALRFFPLAECMGSNELHSISKLSIRYYWDKLLSIMNNCNCNVHADSVITTDMVDTTEQEQGQEHDFEQGQGQGQGQGQEQNVHNQQNLPNDLRLCANYKSRNSRKKFKYKLIDSKYIKYNNGNRANRIFNRYETEEVILQRAIQMNEMWRK